MNLSHFPILSPSPYSLSISSFSLHFLSIFSQPGCQAAIICAKLVCCEIYWSHVPNFWLNSALQRLWSPPTVQLLHFQQDWTLFANLIEHQPPSLFASQSFLWILCGRCLDRCVGQRLLNSDRLDSVRCRTMRNTSCVSWSTEHNINTPKKRLEFIFAFYLPPISNRQQDSGFKLFNSV